MSKTETTIKELSSETTHKFTYEVRASMRAQSFEVHFKNYKFTRVDYDIPVKPYTEQTFVMLARVPEIIEECKAKIGAVKPQPIKNCIVYLGKMFVLGDTYEVKENKRTCILIGCEEDTNAGLSEFCLKIRYTGESHVISIYPHEIQ